MKIDLQSIDVESFMVHQHYVGEHECFLVQPQHIGVVWNEDNLIFRSSLWDSTGQPVSLSFKKFFNFDEKPNISTPPTSLNGAKLMEKLDGSTLIFSRYKGHTVIRTRGTSNARNQENGYEIDYLIEKYNKFYQFLEAIDTTPVSYIFEWLSPTNRIVINYGDEPDMVLTAVIFHNDYSMMTQDGLDTVASQLQLRRPKKYSYNSVSEMKESVEALRDQEGLCVYYNNDQHIRKVKSAHYLACHRMKSEVSSIEKVVDLWFSCGQPSYEDFFKFVSDTFDYEIAAMARGHISQVCDTRKEVEAIIAGFHTFAGKVKHLSRREAAEKILQAYGNTNRASYVFSILDNKPLDADKLKKLTYQVLKK